MAYGSTREQIVQLLRRGPAGVEEISAATGLTPNGVRSQLAALSGDGLVERAGFRKGTGRPARLYRLTQKAVDEFSAAHRPFLASLLRILAQELPAARVRDLLVGAGRSLAPKVAPGAGPEARLEAALGALRGLGAEVEATKEGKSVVIEGCACPLEDAVRTCADVCRAVEALLREVIGRNVEAECRHEGRPACRFRLRA